MVYRSGGKEMRRKEMEERRKEERGGRKERAGIEVKGGKGRKEGEESCVSKECKLITAGTRKNVRFKEL